MKNKFLKKTMMVLLSSMMIFQSVPVNAQSLEEAGLTEETRGYGGAGNQDKNRTDGSILVSLTVGDGESDWNAGTIIYENEIGTYDVVFGDEDGDGDIDMTDCLKKFSGSSTFNYSSSDMGDFYLDIAGCEANGDFTYTLNDVFCNYGTPDLYEGDSIRLCQIDYMGDGFEEWNITYGDESEEIETPGESDEETGDEETPEETGDEEVDPTGILTLQKQEMENLKKQIEDADAESAVLVEAINSLIETLNTLQAEYDAKTITKDKLQAEYDNLVPQLESLLDTYEKYSGNSEEIDKLRAQLEEKKQGIADLQTQKSEVEEKIINLRTGIESLDKAIDKLNGMLASIKAKIKELLQALGLVKTEAGSEKIDKLSTTQYTNQMVDTMKSASSITKTDWQQVLIMKEQGVLDDSLKSKFVDERMDTGIVLSEDGKVNKTVVNGYKGADILRIMVMFDDEDAINAFLTVDGLMKSLGTYAADYSLAYLDAEGYYFEGEELAENLADYASSNSQRDDVVYYIVNTPAIWGGSWWTPDTGCQNAQALVPYYNVYPEVKEKLDSFINSTYDTFIAESYTGASFDASSAGELIRLLAMMGDYDRAMELYNKVCTIGLANTKFKGNTMDVWRMARSESYLVYKFVPGSKKIIDANGNITTGTVDNSDIYGEYRTIDDSGEHEIIVAIMGPVSEDINTDTVE